MRVGSSVMPCFAQFFFFFPSLLSFVTSSSVSAGCFWENFSFFEQFYTLLNCSIRFIEVFQMIFQSQHIIDNVAVYIRFQSFIRFLDQNIPSLYTFRVGKADELLYQTLVTKIIQQVFFRFILAQPSSDYCPCTGK